MSRIKYNGAMMMAFIDIENQSNLKMILKIIKYKINLIYIIYLLFLF